AGAILSLVLSLLILGLLSEATLRVAHAAQVLPAPNMGAANPELGIKVTRLDALAKAKGKIDCIFIGSSAVDADVDPQVMAEVFRTRAGDDLTCFNFALAAMPTASAEMIGKMLITRYHPKILLYGVGPFEFSKDFPDTSYRAPWVLSQAGDVSAEGVLMEYSFLYRYGVGLSGWRDVEQIQLGSKLEGTISSFGFNAYKGDAFEDPPLPAGMDPHSLHPPRFDGYRAFLDSRLTTGVQIVVFELPTQLDFRVKKDPSGELIYRQKLLEPVMADAESRGALFWRTGQILYEVIPLDHFADWQHLNRRGKDVFSRWLGEQLAQEVQQGKLKVR
ncbi:MAG: hypothetical protein HZB17_09280, partial [Chloroflexi bacterium]|nr:hypothetical protein [Chloroflexota bacterium]